MISTRAFLLIVLAVSVSGKYFKGACSEPTLQENFDVEKYIGYWHEIYKDGDFYWEKGGKCTTAEY